MSAAFLPEWKWVARGSCLAILLFLAACAREVGSAQENSENVVKNPGFETLHGKLPAGWILDKQGAHKGEAAVSSRGVHSGERALRLSPNGSNTIEFPLGMTQGFPVDNFRGKQVNLSAWISAEGGATAVAGLYLVRMDGSFAQQVRLTSHDAMPVLKTGSLRVPADASGMFLAQRCSVEGTSGNAYFDDIAVQVEDASAPGALQPLKPAGIQIDAGKVVRPIPATLYGTNVEWIHGGYGLFDPHSDAFRPELVRLTSDLKPSLIRFPGGVFSDYYNWRNGIGPRSARPAADSVPGGDRSENLFGTDEALDFAHQTGARLLITVNIVTGTPNDAAEWVRYVNRNPDHRVAYWEIGNENYSMDNDSNTKAGNLKASVYAQRFLKFAKAMRAADPNIKLGAIGGENRGRYKTLNESDWDDQVLRIAGGQIDFISVHNAYAPLLFIDDSADLRRVYSAMLAAPAIIRDNLAEVYRHIETIRPQDAGRIELAVTEWGPFFHADPRSRYIDHVKTLGSALFVASTLKAFIESPHVDIANFFKLVDNGFMGWIGLRDGQFIPKAPYFAFEMFTRHFGSDLLSSATDSPTFDSEATGLIDARQGVPYLDVVASRGSDKRTIYIMGINRDFDRPITASINLGGFEPGDAVAWTLNGPSIDANTGTELPLQDRIGWAKQAVERTNSHFKNGSPEAIAITSAPIAGVGRTFSYTFPAHSVTSLEIRSGHGPRKGQQ